jgi:hypothetical protein
MIVVIGAWQAQRLCQRSGDGFAAAWLLDERGEYKDTTTVLKL